MEDNHKKCEDTKARLIDAAGEVFARQGYQSATVRDICSRAGTHVGAVNYHFRDKDGLYAAVLKYSHQSAKLKYPPDIGLQDNPTPKDKLRSFILSLLLRMLSDGFPAWHGKLMAQEIANPTPAVDSLVEGFVRPVYDYLTGILNEMLYDDVPPEEDTSDVTFLCAMSVLGQCMQYFMGRRLVDHVCPKSFDPKNIERIADHITRLTVYGIRELDLRSEL